MAAHSDPVSLPEGDADEFPETMVTPSLVSRHCRHKGHPRRSIPPARIYIGGNGMDVLGDTSMPSSHSSQVELAGYPWDGG